MLRAIFDRDGTNPPLRAVALKPPLGYRTWNQFDDIIDQTIFPGLAAGLVDTSRLVKGRGYASLASLGYSNLGMDEGWAQCGPWPPGFYQYHNGSSMDGPINPVVDKVKFPDMAGLVELIHSLNLTAGWYLNDCLSYCRSLGDNCSLPASFAGDVAAAVGFGFDSIKFDGCSAQRDLDLWSSLLNASGKPVVIENCHNGSPPTRSWGPADCPNQHTYRSSTDIRNTYGSVVSNAQTVLPYVARNLSGPGCWAYPDMMMVG